MRDQVGLAQVGGAPHSVHVLDTYPGRERFDQALDAPGFVQHRTQFGLEDQRAQARQEILQLVVQVLVDEKGRVGIAGADNLLVAVRDNIQVLVVPVAHGDKDRQQAPFGGLGREVALVLLHYRDEHLGRQA